MQINKEQKAFLNSFKCVRLSSIKASKEWLDSFINNKNTTSQGLVKHLKENGCKEDIDGRTAYYIILSADGCPCLYFSLQCASLFDVPFDENRHNKKLEQYRQTYSNNASTTNDPLLIKWVKSITNRIENKISIFHEDQKKEAGRNIFRVDNIYSSVELVHFCVNENAGIDWSIIGPRHTKGEVFFWSFVVPVIEKLQDVVGCKYIHLFAADTSEEGKLINYYTVALHFKLETSLGVTKPLYDFSCTFLSQDIAELRIQRDLYFNEFNLDPGEIVA